jgi:hypothetical protein
VVFDLPKEIFIEDVMCGAGGRMRRAVHSFLIFSAPAPMKIGVSFFSFAAMSVCREEKNVTEVLYMLYMR